MTRADWTKDPKWASSRLPNVDLRAMDLFWPVSTGGGFSPAMRLVALCMMVHEEHGESTVYWDHDMLADRTGLTVEQVAKALDQLRLVHLVRETAAGPMLTFSDWDENTRKQWLDDAIRRRYEMRPTRPSGSSKPDQENQDDDREVEARRAGGDGHEARAGGGRAAP
jgi:hypothetical protein